MKAREALREADQAFQQTPLPPAALARLRRRVFDGPSRAPRLVLAAAALVLVAGAALVLWPRGTDVEDVRLGATQRFAHARFEIVASTDAVIHRDHDALTLLSGDVEVSVAKHPEPVRLRVSHGDIVVVGTKFTLRQRAQGGDVTLHEGAIHFVSAEGTHVVAVGETFAWPPPPAPPAEAALPRPEPVPQPEPAPQPAPEPRPLLKRSRPSAARAEPAVIRETDAAWLLSEVETCRSRGEYAEAVRLLDKGLAGLVSPATRERFSFELGSILTWQLSDARACAHWASHLGAFPAGRYAREVERAMERAKCGSR